MEQTLFPVAAASHCIEIIEADQLAQLKVVEQLRAVLHHFAERQIHHRFATLLKTQAGRLQQVAAPDAFGAPQVDQAFRPAGVGLAQALDIAQGRGIGAGVVIGEGGVITQTHPQGKLDGFHVGGSWEPLLSP